MERCRWRADVERAQPKRAAFRPTLASELYAQEILVARHVEEAHASGTFLREKLGRSGFERSNQLGLAGELFVAWAPYDELVFEAIDAP